MDRTFLVKEYAKSSVRGALRHFDLGLVRGPFDSQVLRTLAWLQVDTVLDVGANIGQYAGSLFAGGFGGRVVSCEPLADAHGELARRAARNSRWDAVRTAVGAESGSLTVNVAANSYSSSALGVNATHLAADERSRRIGSQTVPLTTVDDLTRQFGVTPSTTLLKVDTQGYEAHVLDGAAGTLSQFAAVQLELSFVPLYDGQALFPELSARLVAAGFELFSLGPGISDPDTGRLLQADGLFVRADAAGG